MHPCHACTCPRSSVHAPAHHSLLQLLHKKSVKAIADVDEQEILSQCKNAKSREKLRAAIHSMKTMNIGKDDEAAVIIAKAEEPLNKATTVSAPESTKKSADSGPPAKKGGSEYSSICIMYTNLFTTRRTHNNPFFLSVCRALMCM